MLLMEPFLRCRQSFSDNMLNGRCHMLNSHSEQNSQSLTTVDAIRSDSFTEDDGDYTEPVLQDPDFSPDYYRGDDSFWTVLASVVKIVVCFSAMLLTTVLWSLILIVLLPFPYARIKQGNVYGHVTGAILLWILGNPIKIYGKENSNCKAIYVCNHASPLDIFLAMWLIPTGTVGIAKKEIIWYPLFGQLYVLANHLRIDRSNRTASIESMRKIATAVVEKSLSLLVFPEGTRSATGRLLPFKKGFVHLAIQTKLPIVPMVLTGTHHGWQKNSLRVRPAPLTVTYLPPIRTDDWTIDKVDKYVEMLHDVFVQHLPKSQRPLDQQESQN